MVMTSQSKRQQGRRERVSFSGGGQRDGGEQGGFGGVTSARVNYMAEEFSLKLELTATGRGDGEAFIAQTNDQGCRWSAGL